MSATQRLKPAVETPAELNLRLATQTYLTVAEAAAYLRKPTVSAFRQWAYDARLPRCKAGRSVLYRRRDLDTAIDPQSKHFAGRGPSAVGKTIR